MSIKRQIQFKYQNFIKGIQCLSLPRWVDSLAIRVVVVAVLFVVGVAYIVKTASSATSGYEMTKLEKQVVALENDIQKVQIEIADSSSIKNVQSRLVKLNMVPANGFKYLTTKSSVAKN
ncbi:MAG: hypothetical protein AAB348_02990 [Patescibacteria group bacterium]